MSSSAAPKPPQLAALAERLRSRPPSAAPRPRPLPESTPDFELKAQARGFDLHRPVGDSADLRRILALPRRPHAALPSAAQVEALMHELRRPGGTRTLLPVQALSLLEAQRVGGLLAPLGPGEGKTDICANLPEVMDSAVALLLVPASLRNKFVEIEYPQLATHYRLPNLQGSRLHYPDTKRLLHVMSYEQLSRHTSTALLARLSPDLVICDEAHRLKNLSAVATRRLKRFRRERRGVRFCFLSGSMTVKSIRDFAHLAEWALGDGSPLPHDWLTLMEWAAALDPGELPAPPGELLSLSRPGESVRSGFQRRLVETPGVVASSGERLPVALNIHERPLPLTRAVEKALDGMRESWVTPGGETIPDALSFSRYARQLAGGFYTRWIWPREEPLELRLEWLEARAEWHKEVREFLKHSSREGMDSPFLLAQAAVLGGYSSRNWDRWSGVKGLCQPETEVVWIDDYMVRDAAEWGRKNVGVIWYSHDALGRAIAEAGGFPLYAGGEVASLELQRESGKRTVLASANAHGEGKNLQQFNSQLITTPSSNGKWWEQLTARMHRRGQSADEVECHVYLNTPEMRGALKAARANAEYFSATLGAVQRLQYATYSFAL